MTGASLPTRARRAFTLPVVLLLVLIAGITVAVMLERQTAQSLTVNRELEAYTFRHVSKGVQEAVEAWLRISGASRAMAENIDTDGHAFDLTLDSGQNVRILFFDGQDKALIEMAGLSATAREEARLILQELQARAGPKARALVRRDGPLAVSANTAPPEVLYAVINAVTEGDGTEQLVNEVIYARNEKPLDAQALTEVLNQSSLEVDARNRLAMTLTAQPTLWRVVAEADSPSNVYPRRPPRRYCGTVVLTAPGGGVRDKTTALERSSMIIEWQDCTEQTEE